MIIYNKPPNIRSADHATRPTFLIHTDGRIVVDRILQSIWEVASRRELAEIVDNVHIEDANGTKAALACIAEAGLLERNFPVQDMKAIPPASNAHISVVTVSYNSRKWLETCLPSILTQTHSNLDVIVVDNGSSDHTVAWVTEKYSNVKLIQLDQPHSLAHALNSGVKAAEGEYVLLLNPDVVLDPNAVANLVAKALDNHNCAAVAAKLKLQWAPAFINGLGNYVGPVSWGTDIALGHLDLGQFDDWREVPSACFATALISSAAYIDVGPLDEKFPMYYEDSEWCYRARLFGYSILAAPKAIGFHAFGSRTSSNEEISLTPRKLRQVVYGRLRFSTKILGPCYLLKFLCLYILEDITNMILSILWGRWQKLRAYTQAWADYWIDLPEMLEARKVIQARRQCTDKELFSLQKDVPMPLTWHGSPELTWDIVRHQYLPLIISGQTRPFPEFEAISTEKLPVHSSGKLGQLVRRASNIRRAESFSGLLHRIGRTIQWHLMRL